MRTSRVVVAVFAPIALSLTLTMAAGCEEPAVCGDGVVGRGEDESTCCLDTGCSFGACDPGSRSCLDPWQVACAGSDACFEEGPYRCQGATPPAYDCGACGCAGDDRCEQDVCWSLDEIRARRDDAEVSTSLDLDDYFGLVDELQRPDLTLSELNAEVAAHAGTDRRHSVVLFALASSSEREREVAEELSRRLDDEGVLSLTAGASMLERDSLEAACERVEELATERFGDEGASFVYGHAAEAHRETCFYEELWARCGPPTLEGCVTRAGRLPLTLLLVDFAAALDVVDRALLIRATNRPEGERLFHLDQAISRWRQSIDAWPAPDEYAVALESGAVVVRAAPSARYQGTWWVALPSPGKAPWGLLGFRLLWNDGDTNAFLSQHDIVGRDCSWSLGATTVAYACENDGARVEAVIDIATQVVISLERTPPP